MPKKHIVLVDIDHTISNAARRDELIKDINTDWDEYHAAAIDDEPVTAIADIIKALYLDSYRIIGLTARPRKWEGLTTTWCARHHIPVEHFLMREDDDYRPAAELKVALAKAHFGDALPDVVALVLDDRADVLERFAALGVTTLKVTAGAQ